MKKSLTDSKTSVAFSRRRASSFGVSYPAITLAWLSTLFAAANKLILAWQTLRCCWRSAAISAGQCVKINIPMVQLSLPFFWGFVTQGYYIYYCKADLVGGRAVVLPFFGVGSMLCSLNFLHWTLFVPNIVPKLRFSPSVCSCLSSVLPASSCTTFSIFPVKSWIYLQQHWATLAQQ